MPEDQVMPIDSSHMSIPVWGRRVAGVFFIVLVFFAGWFTGRTSATASSSLSRARAQQEATITPQVEDDVNFSHFWTVWDFVKENYYKQPISNETLFQGAIKGMVAALDDPYSVYFDPEEAQAFNANLEGSFDGIGAEIGIKDDQLQIVAPLPGTPAKRAGLLPGDAILAIGDVTTDTMTVEEAVLLIRGEAGSQVVLKIYREGQPAPYDVPIIREKIVVDSVRYEFTPDQLAHISVYTFNQETNELFNDAVNKALAAGARGIILDLRSNPGGLLSSAKSMASAWVGYDPVLIERQQGVSKTLNGVAAPRLAGFPTVVLVNGGSASGSEIVAGALQDYGLATLVGTQTFGKGSVQDYRDLEDGSAIKVTIADWFTPKERSINELGITPDVEVPLTIEDLESEHDPQLETAIRILLELFGNSRAQ